MVFSSCDFPILFAPPGPFYVVAILFGAILIGKIPILIDKIPILIGKIPILIDKISILIGKITVLIGKIQILIGKIQILIGTIPILIGTFPILFGVILLGNQTQSSVYRIFRKSWPNFTAFWCIIFSFFFLYYMFYIKPLDLHCFYENHTIDIQNQNRKVWIFLCAHCLHQILLIYHFYQIYSNIFTISTKWGS